MKQKDLISIVVPVYGVEQYLAECVDSILTQTYENIELILVDDESPDNCPIICDEYAKKDARVRVIHKKNGGAASARNVGLKEARGEYICLIDSDDWVEPTFVERLLCTLQENQADVSVCSFDNCYTDGVESNPILYPQEQSFAREQFLQRFLMDWTSGMAVNKIFKRSVLDGVYYEEGHKIDDEFFTYKSILRSEKIVMFDEPLYHYRIRKSSVMQSGCYYQERMMLDKLDYMQKRYTDIQLACPILKKDFYVDLVDSFAGFWKASYGMKQAQTQLKRWKQKNFFLILGAKMPLKIKLGYIKVLYFSRPKPIKKENQTATLYTCFA